MSKTSHILTWNLRDFPVGEMKKHGLVCQTPDIFLVELYDEMPELVVTSLSNARRNLAKSGVSAVDFFGMLGEQKLLQFESRVRQHVADL